LYGNLCLYRCYASTIIKDTVLAPAGVSRRGGSWAYLRAMEAAGDILAA